MRRLLCCLLVALFSAGFLPGRRESCGCTAERNCGCDCWRARPDSRDAAAATRERACCPLSRSARGAEGKRGDGCGLRRGPHGGPSDGADPFAPARDPAARRAMEWILAEVTPPAPPAFLAYATPRRRSLAGSWTAAPASPPPRTFRFG